MAGHSGEMIGDVLYMLWISAAAVLLGLLIRAAFRRVKKEIRRKERERLEREGRIIFREKIDDVDIRAELKECVGQALMLTSCFSLIFVVVLLLMALSKSPRRI